MIHTHDNLYSKKQVINEDTISYTSDVIPRGIEVDKEEFSPIDVSNYSITETGQVIKNKVLSKELLYSLCVVKLLLL